MKTITIRGVDPLLTRKLQDKARHNNESINKSILKILRKELGIDQQSTFKTYHDLDHLAGTWSAKQVKEFKKNTESFNKIDSEMWD